MVQLLNQPATYADVFLLIFVRFLTFFNVVPVFSSRNVPQYTKIGYSFFMTLILMQLGVAMPEVTSNEIIPFAILLLKEFGVGWVLGMVVYFVYTAVLLAGTLIDTQIGFSMVNVMDPMTESSLPITGNVYTILLTLLLLISRTHYFFIKGIYRSFELIPPGTGNMTPLVEHNVISYFSEALVIALQISMPIVGGMFVINVVMAVMARTVPQINMFVVGIPLKMLAGFIMLLLSVAYFGEIYTLLMDKMVDYLELALRSFMV